MKLLGDFDFPDFDFSDFDFSEQNFDFDIPTFETFDDFGNLDFSEIEIPNVFDEPEVIAMDDWIDNDLDYYFDEPEPIENVDTSDNWIDDDLDYYFDDLTVDEIDPIITGESPQIWEGSGSPPVVRNQGDEGIDISKILRTAGSVVGAAAGEFFKYTRTVGPNGQPIYTPQRIPNPPPGTRYDASGRLVYVSTGQPVRVDTYGRVVDSTGRVVSTTGTYDQYGRPITTGTSFMQNLPPYAIPLGIAALVAIVAFSGGSKK